MIDGSAILDERYFEWLYSIVASLDDRDPSRSHFVLCETLHNTPFEWFVSRDSNRAEYGRGLRYEFLDETGLIASSSWLELESSIFEMLIALSNTAGFQTDMPAEPWFWIMISNIGLGKFTDDVYNDAVHRSVNEKLRRVIHRQYEASGRGGFFPLRNPQRDQRDVELWYQLSAYLIENFDF